jgi:hypothetical protein
MLVPLPGVVDGFGKIAGDRAGITRRSVRLHVGEMASRQASRAICGVRQFGRLCEAFGGDFSALARITRGSRSGPCFLRVQPELHV